MTKTKKPGWTPEEVWERELGLEKYKFPRSEKSSDFIETAKTVGLVIFGSVVFLVAINKLGQMIFPAIPDLSRIWEHFL